jgi:hypothetical protein
MKITDIKTTKQTQTMKTTRTITELQKFNIYGAAYLEKFKDTPAVKDEKGNVTTPAILQENKLCSAIKKFTKQLEKIFNDFNENKDDLQIDNCLTYTEGKEKGAIMKDEKGNRLYSKEGERALKKSLKEEMEKSIDIHARIPEGIDDLIVELEDYEKESFSGLIIPEQAKEE